MMLSPDVRLWTAKYFLKSQTIAAQRKKTAITTMQFFQLQDHVVLCGVKSCLQLIARAAPRLNLLKIWALADGTVISAREVVLTIEGPYWCFAFLEGQIDGILAHQTTIATNAARLVQSAGQNRIIYMNDRNNFADQQAREGYAAYVGGVRIFTAQGQTQQLSDASVQTIGSIPHSFIQLYEGDLATALRDYRLTFPHESLTALIDFNNDCLGTIRKIKNLLPLLFAVRIDTSPRLIDRALTGVTPAQFGVTPLLVSRVRTLLDDLEHHNIKIIVSSGFTPTKINAFRQLKAPVDFFGVGLAFNQNLISFTGDAVKSNDHLCAKTGRKYRFNSRLKRIDTSQLKTSDA